MNEMSAMPAPASGRTGEIAFDRGAAGLIGIVVKGFLLSIVTFTIYRFWYVTNLRRFFWSRTVVAGSPAEYTGRGKELFLGFLVALAILVPVYVGLAIIGFAIPALAPFAGPISFVFLFLLGQYAIYRGRRYRASRTLWRGIRLSQDGSAFAYVWMAFGWWLLTLLTLGLAFPFMRASLERYRINHTLVGDSRMTSTATGRSILLPWLLFYALGILPALALVGYWLSTHHFTVPTDVLLPDPKNPGEEIFNPAYLDSLEGPWPYLASAVLTAFPIALLLLPFYRARETRIFMNAASLSGANLASSLKARQFYWPYIVYFLTLIGFLLVLGLIFAAVTMIVTATGDKGLGGSSGAFLLIVIGYPGLLLASAVLYVKVIAVRLWHAVATTTTIENVAALEAVLASSRRVGRGRNEGLAAALDVGGAIEIGF